MHAKTVKKNNVYLHAVVDHAINKLFHRIEKYKISSIIYLPENQASHCQFTEEKKIRARFLLSPHDANTCIVG